MRYSRRLFLLIGVFCALLVGTAARAAHPVSVDATVTPLDALFRYSYSITNNTGADISLVSLFVPRGEHVIQNLIAPEGFLASFDPGLGIVDFVEDTQVFAPGVTFTGFGFDSPLPPGGARFEALDVEGRIFQGGTIAPIPEPGTLALVLTALPGLAWICRRRSLT